jgi:long-chain acyl-CoA synthetase
VPVSWHGKTQEIAYVLNYCGARAVVAHADLLPEVVDDKRREIGRDGLVTLGDVGYLFICDRERDMVISGGVNIYPAEIEMALLATPGVRDCGVFGIPDEEFGEKLRTHIEPDPAVLFGAAEVAAFLCERPADFQVPRVIKFETTLPREDSGKIIKRKLRELYWAPAGRNI